MDNNTKVKVDAVGTVCVYCGTETSDACCGEIHHEMAYEDSKGNLILESELEEYHEID